MNPRRLTPSMSLLIAFDAAARHRSFTRAADELSLSQSGVSRQVQALESLLEVFLFKRDGRHLVLTEVGAMYQREVSAALQRIRDASLQAVSYRSGGGAFHLAALPTFASKWLMPRLNGFYAQHPGTLVHVHARIGQFDLDLAGIDAVIGVGDGTWSGMQAHHLMDEQLVPVISADLVRHEPLRQPADLSRHLLLHVASRPDAWRRWFQTQGLVTSNMRPGPHFELTSHLIQAVGSGIGVGLLPTILVEDELRSGVLQCVFDLPMITGASYWFFVPPQKAELPPIKAFRQWLEGACQASRHHT